MGPWKSVGHHAVPHVQGSPSRSLALFPPKEYITGFALLSPKINVLSKMDVRFDFSVLYYATYDLSCVRVFRDRGHLRHLT